MILIVYKSWLNDCTVLNGYIFWMKINDFLMLSFSSSFWHDYFLSSLQLLSQIAQQRDSAPSAAMAALANFLKALYFRSEKT